MKNTSVVFFFGRTKYLNTNFLNEIKFYPNGDIKHLNSTIAVTCSLVIDDTLLL